NYLSFALGQHITQNYRLGCRFLGYIAPPTAEGDVTVPEVLGGVEALRQLTRLHFVDEVVIAQALPTEHVIFLLEEARELGIDIRAISGLYGELAANGAIEYLGVYPVTPLHRSRSKVFSTFFKRVFDLTFSMAALIAAFPLMLVISLAVRFDSEGPIFYVSERIGKRGRVFPCFKFRTMVKDAEKRKKELAALNERDGILFKVSNDPRITRTGRFLRKYSLDELPQFFNVLRGEMSIVGPRPPIAIEVAKYELEHFRRLEVMPGLTGLWQVHARQDSSFAKYIELDTAYVENWSFWLDVKILLKTAFVVVRGTGT
ncbi:MAG TPA: sugar transferase, partial [Pseudacidobacterium sp.]|nr:sugar transferase [Pseudacidobacterium sp.]